MFSTTTVNPNVFESKVSKVQDLEAPSTPTNLVDLEEAKSPGPTMDLDGKLEEENFGQAINENVAEEDVTDPLTKPASNKKGKK